MKPHLLATLTAKITLSLYLSRNLQNSSLSSLDILICPFNSDNTIRGEATNALWNYHIASTDYGVVECCHQIFLHGVV